MQIVNSVWFINAVQLLAGCLGGLFSQILQGDEIVRDRAINFMQVKLKQLTAECWTQGVEDVFITESKKVSKSNAFIALIY